VDTCVDVEHGGERKNYTPQPPKEEDALKQCAAPSWVETVSLCVHLGMKDTEDVFAFIHDLAGRAGEERYSIPEIARWICRVEDINDMEIVPKRILDGLNDPRDGIKAVTERNKTKGG